MDKRPNETAAFAILNEKSGKETKMDRKNESIVCVVPLSSAFFPCVFPHSQYIYLFPFLGGYRKILICYGAAGQLEKRFSSHG